MILFYIIEAVAIYTVLKQHPHDADAAVHPFHISCSVVLPQLVSGSQGLPLHLLTSDCLVVGERSQEHNDHPQEDVATATSSVQTDAALEQDSHPCLSVQHSFSFH